MCVVGSLTGILAARCWASISCFALFIALLLHCDHLDGEECKNLSLVRGVDRKIRPEDHCLAS